MIKNNVPTIVWEFRKDDQGFRKQGGTLSSLSLDWRHKVGI